MTVTYQVGGGGHLDIDFWVSYPGNNLSHSVDRHAQLQDPDNRVLGKQVKQSTGTLSITAEKNGRHEYCFSNQMSAIADKIVRYLVSDERRPNSKLTCRCSAALTCTESFMLARMVCRCLTDFDAG